MNLYDIAYGLLILVAAPFWLTVPAARRKVLEAAANRMGKISPRREDGPAVLIHAVSLGEINATVALVKLLLAQRNDLHVVVSTTTETGHARGMVLYGSEARISVIRFPVDFSWAVRRLLNAVKPSLVVLMELELWPNFLRQCQKRRIPVLLMNGRMTTSTYQRYRRIRPIVAGMLRRLNTVCAQDEDYARRFVELGSPPDRTRVTGTMKFDTANVSDHVEGDLELSTQLGLMPGEIIWLCGSTGPGEEEILLRIYRDLLAQFPQLRLIIVPRKPERFDEVAGPIQQAGFGLLRRSEKKIGEAGAVILGDTMGELRRFYSLADVVFVGRSLVDLGSRQHGSDMIEPAALAKPIVVGPWTGNFADAMNRFRAAGAIAEVRSESELRQTLERWLNDRAGAMEIGRRAQEVVRNNQGATQRHAKIVLDALAKA